MDGKEGGEKSRLMTRGEFIGTGAAAAAGVGLAGVAGATAAGPSPVGAQEAQPTGPPTDWEWAIPAGVLNILWSDVFPRIVAREWRNPDPNTGVKPGMGVAELRTELDNLPGSADFRARVFILQQHLEHPKCMPFHVAGRGGYDFVITRDRVDFFLPERPKTVLGLLRYYTFRNTGRPAIGLPFYLADAISAVSIDSPTGPSQVRVDRGTLPGAESSPFVIRQRGTAGDELVMSEDTYRRLAGDSHGWAVEGAVYRGMMTEVPRVVANCWIEDKSGCVADGNNSYRDRIKRTGNDGLRSIFEERLETSLPHEQQMVFELHPPDRPSSVPWASNDVMVTNRGFYFPPVRRLPDDPDTALNDLLAQIAEGKAGNPVFTDSKRTMT